MKPKRIILIVPIFPQLSETFIVSKFLGLLARGWDVHIVAQKFDTQAWARFPQLQNNPQARRRVHLTWPHQPRGVAALLFPPGLMYGLVTAPRRALRYMRRGWACFGRDVLRQFYLDLPLIRLGPDIVHFEFGALAVGRTHPKDLLDAKLSVSFRGYDLNFVKLDDPEYYRGVWQAVDGCHLLSEALWLRAQDRGCSAHMSHALIPPALDLKAFPELSPKIPATLGTPEQPLRILSVGRLEWKKGYEHAMLAIKLLQEQGVVCKYRVIGAGNYVHALYYARHQLGLESLIEFCGALPHEGVLKHLATADVFLHPSLSEGFCNAVLEAQAMCLPVVCSNAGGLPENVVEGETGFVVPRRDPHAMAKKLALLAEDGRLRQRMGQAGRKRVEGHFQLEQQLDAFEAFYTNLLENELQEKNT